MPLSPATSALCLLALALLSFGQSWTTDRHHADPTKCVDRGRLGTSATVIRLLERLGRGHAVRRPRPARVAIRRA
ncbi:hypothetical protein ABZ307_27325 [Streptomyces griseorubiginosus]|uniref:hypothetical protein n=1 Tax=Streptomyces griseorubiginosus TaxID=67304 RepID=UPI0033A0056C